MMLLFSKRVKQKDNTPIPSFTSTLNQFESADPDLDKNTPFFMPATASGSALNRFESADY